MIDAEELRRNANNGIVLSAEGTLSLIDALEKARGENDTFVSGMADLAERANAAIAKAVSERDSARALLRVIHGWIDNSPADRARIEKELGQ